MKSSRLANSAKHYMREDHPMTRAPVIARICQDELDVFGQEIARAPPTDMALGDPETFGV